jgi:hypothetical protein
VVRQEFRRQGRLIPIAESIRADAHEVYVSECWLVPLRLFRY